MRTLPTRPKPNRPRSLALLVVPLALAALPASAAHPEPYLIQDRVPGPARGGPVSFHPLGDRMLAYTFDLVEGSGPIFIDRDFRSELIVSDGTPEGTGPLLPADVTFAWWWITPGPEHVNFFAACPAPVSVQFACSHRTTSLWRTDGTTNGTFPVSEAVELHDRASSLDALYVEDRGLLFFRGADTEQEGQDFELWVTDGTPEGTRLLAELNPEGDGFPGWMVELDSFLYFTYRQDTEDGIRFLVGRSDGTPEGTGPRPAPSDPRASAAQLWRGDDEVFVFYRVPGEAISLWRDDGSPGGPVLLEEDLGISSRFDLRVFDDAGEKLYFMTGNSSGLGLRDARLWVSDGTPEGTRQVPRPSGTVFWDGFSYRTFERVGDLFYYTIDDGVHGLEPWVTDGTPEGTRMLRDLCPGSCGVQNLFRFLEVGDRVMFSFSFDGNPRVLMVYDPETGDLGELASDCPGECGLSFPFATVGDLTYFGLFDSIHGVELWVTDGTPAGTLRLTDFEGTANPFRQSIGPQAPSAVAGGRLFFAASDPDHGWELWAVPLPEEGTEFPQRPPGNPLTSPELPGFDVWVRITPGAGDAIPGRSEGDCIPDTLCVSGAVPGRSEVFVRVVGPKPNGFLWPTLVKFTTSTVEVWIEQRSTGAVRFYRLEGASPGSSDLPGLFDRRGFQP